MDAAFGGGGPRFFFFHARQRIWWEDDLLQCVSAPAAALRGEIFIDHLRLLLAVVSGGDIEVTYLYK